MSEFPAPPGFRLTSPRPRSRIVAHAAFVDPTPIEDQDRPKKQRHTIRRIFERLRDERGFQGGYTTVRAHIRPRRQFLKEADVPLTHPPGRAQADFGEAVAVLGGAGRKSRFFVLSLPASDAVFVKACHAKTAKAYCDGQVEAFAFFGGAPSSVLYGNAKLAVAQILGPPRRLLRGRLPGDG